MQSTFLDGRPGFESVEIQTAMTEIDLSRFQTWWFLHYVDGHRSVMRSEFSLPVRVGKAGEMDEWARRIILDPISFNDGPDVNRRDSEVAQRTEATVTIKRKAS